MFLFAETYSKDPAVKWWAYLRIFYMLCAGLSVLRRDAMHRISLPT
jgi:hypothetical protein